jgi:predicted CoA-binding protein
MIAPLSPAAQAVLDAALNAADSVFVQAGTTRQGIAAALRAAADQVIDGRCQNESEKRIYDRLRRIATELGPTP